MDEYFENTFARAAARGNVRILKQMLKKGVDVNRYISGCKTALVLALGNAHDGPVSTQIDDPATTVETCRPDAVNLLIQAGADVNKCADNYCIRIAPLWFAVTYNCVQCVTLLIEAGADVKSWYVQESLLCLASYEGHYQCLSLLIKVMGDVVKAHTEPLRSAAAVGHVKCVSLLINAGVDANSTNHYRQTPLMDAVNGDHVACVSLLIKAGADVNHKDSHYRVVLSYASSPETIRLLLRSGAQINRCLPGWKLLGKRSAELLLAAGETRFKTTFYWLPKADDLMGMCRKAIRSHLQNLDSHIHLFGRVEKLGLPAALARYLVFDQSLDDDNSPSVENDNDADETGEY